MPINYKEYHPKWKLISKLICVNRAKNKCEWCGVKNYSRVMRSNGLTTIILTVAHIDHDKTNNRFGNLAALCQKCHLGHDIKQHADNRKYGRKWKGDHQLKINL